MSQIVQRGNNPIRCKLAAISSGGSKASVVLDAGEIWLVDTSSEVKGASGYGMYDCYITGDGINYASALELKKIDETDAEPVSGSIKPVQSGGVWLNHSKVNPIAEALGEEAVELDITWDRSHAWVANNGKAEKTSAADSVTSGKITVTEKNVYRFSARPSNNYTFIYLVDEYDNIIESYSAESGANRVVYFVAPTGAAYALLTARNNYTRVFREYQYEDVPAIHHSVDDLQCENGNVVYRDWVEEMIHRTDTAVGSVMSMELTSNSGNNCIADPIPCVAGDVFSMNILGHTNSNMVGWVFLDSNYVVLSKCGTDDSDRYLYNVPLVAPANAAWLVVNCSRSYTNDPCVIKGVGHKVLVKDVDDIKERSDIDEVYNKFVDGQCYYLDVDVTIDPTTHEPVTTSLSAVKCMHVACEGGDRFSLNFTGRNNSHHQPWGFIDANGIVLKSSGKGTTAWKNVVVTAPANSAWLLINAANAVAGGEVAKGVTHHALTRLVDEIDTGVGGDTAVVPDYYLVGANNYLNQKINTILGIFNNGSVNMDSFFFITDVHYHKNQGNSPALIKYIRQRTGISKLFFGGDMGTTNSTLYTEAQKAGIWWDNFDSCVKEFFGVIGNHEFQHDPSYKLPGVVNFYSARFKRDADGMNPSITDYYIDNKVNKIRYIFLHNRSVACPYGDTVKWFGDSLLSVEDNYAIVVIIHDVWMDSRASYHQSGGRWIEQETSSYIRSAYINQILNAFVKRITVSISATGTDAFTYSKDFANAKGTVVGIFGGHRHQGVLVCAEDKFYDINSDGSVILTNGQPKLVDNPYKVNAFRGGTDSFICNYDVNGGNTGNPWYWDNYGIEYNAQTNKFDYTGTQVVRENGTTDEQCFYVVQIDRNVEKIVNGQTTIVGKVYITAIGGDRDYEFEFDVENE